MFLCMMGGGGLGGGAKQRLYLIHQFSWVMH
jgi:hypothetical protein